MPEQIEIVATINNSKRRTDWNTTEKDLYGTIGKYHVRLASYYKRKKDEKIMHYPILCPYALGFDFTFQKN